MAPLEQALAVPPVQHALPSLEVEVFVRMMMATQQLRAGVDAACEARGLTLQQYKVLRFLRANPDGVPRCVVSRQCSHSSPDMTRMIDRLVRRRLVVRVRSSEDGRMSVARLTRQGNALLDALDPAVDQAIEYALEPLDRADRQELSRLCAALISQE